jgi:hypothetical protein
MPFVCEKCGFIFDSRTKLNSHMNRKNPCISNEVDSSSISCDYCHNKFATNFTLKRHSDRCAVRNNPKLLVKMVEELMDKRLKYKKQINDRDIIIKRLTRENKKLRKFKEVK